MKDAMDKVNRNDTIDYLQMSKTGKGLLMPGIRKNFCKTRKRQ